MSKQAKHEGSISCTTFPLGMKYKGKVELSTGEKYETKDRFDTEPEALDAAEKLADEVLKEIGAEVVSVERED